MTQFNASAMQIMTKSMEDLCSTQNLAETAKTILESGYDLKKSGTSAMDKAVNKQIGDMRLKIAGTALQDLALQTGDSMTELVDAQVKLLNF